MLRGLPDVARLASACAAAVTLLVASAASAQTTPPPPPAGGGMTGEAAAAQFPECTRQPSESDVDGAKGAHKAATQFFERGDYDRAIQYWRDAYGFDCSRPPLLLNIASAYEKKNEKAAAVGILELFLARAKDSPDAPTVREKIANLKAAIGSEPAQPPPPVEPPPPPPPPPPSPPEKERPFGALPWVVVGSGAGIALVGLVPFIIGEGKQADAEKACPLRKGCAAEVAEQGNTGRTLSLVGEILMPIGIIGAAGGLVWQFGFNDAREVDGAAGIPLVPSRASGQAASHARVVDEAHLTPVVVPGFQGAVVEGAF